jgi:tRNA-specific 2-thiouridylase
MTEETVAVAMSGGVDSSVAAALLVERGRKVFGLTMDLGPALRPACGEDDGRACCGRRSIEDANRLASGLGIVHYLLDVRREFEKEVVDYFCREYARGRTPNPCVKCNERIKFGLLAAKARRLGAGALATGHHARLAWDDRSGRRQLRKGRDAAKDQSYFLHSLSQEQLGFARYPIGELTKAEVRAEARRLGLSVADKAESREICFIADDDYARFLRSRLPRAVGPGPILDPRGKVIGRHPGIIHFTVGQRRGLGVAWSRPLYVVGIDTARNAVVAGPVEALYGRTFEVTEVNWASIAGLDRRMTLTVKIRSRHEGAEAEVEPAGPGRCRVTFAVPQRAITPGQSAVFYDGDLLLGGGVISLPAGAAPA